MGKNAGGQPLRNRRAALCQFMAVCRTGHLGAGDTLELVARNTLLSLSEKFLMGLRFHPGRLTLEPYRRPEVSVFMSRVGGRQR